MAKFLDVARFTPTLGGTTDWTVSAAVTGYQTPVAAGAIDGINYRYRAESADLSQWEIGYGVSSSTGTVFARTTVLFNSSGTTSKISFSTVPTVGIVPLAEDFREKLDAARTYYVRTDGSDTAGTGLTNAAYISGVYPQACAFLTVAKALTMASTLDTADQQLTIQVNAGTWTVPISFPRMVGGLLPILTGVGSTTIVNTNVAGSAIMNNGGTPWIVQSLKVAGGASTTFLISANGGGLIKISSVELGVSSGYGLYSDKISGIIATGNLTFSGAIAGSAMRTEGLISIRSVTVTYSGTPAFGICVEAAQGGYIDFFGTTNSGSTTGQRYLASSGGSIFTNGGGANFFPGSVAGVSTTGYYT